MIAGLGPFEIIVILVVVLLIFGPKNLPKLGKSLGKTVKNIREGMDGEDGEATEKPAQDVEETVGDEDSDEPAGVFCSKCGTKNDADAEFCSKCGAKLNGAE